MRRLLLIFMPFFLITACTSAKPTVEPPTATQIPTATLESTSLPAPTSTPVITTPVIEAQEPTKTVDVPPYSEYTSGKLWLHLVSPKDDDTVTESLINVTGQAPAETVISLNDDIFLVPADGNFSIPVALDEGPNVIELVASNTEGDEIELVLTVVYEE